jgi:hypothetical protein
MTLDEALTLLQAAREKHGGGAEMVFHDLSSTDPMAVVRLEKITAATAHIIDHKGMGFWILDEEPCATHVPVIVLD